MRSAKDEGTKIAAASKELNVTSVTIRRYISEFEIETTSDDNGVKVLPANAMKELHEIRRMKEEGMSNTQVIETLEEMRSKSGYQKPKKEKKASKPAREENEESSEETEESEPPVSKKDTRKTTSRRKPKVSESTSEETNEEETAEEASGEEEEDESKEKEEDSAAEGAQGNKSKHSLTCQTCGKTFEHLNPRLRDCLDCYRTKRKERRRGGADRHKNVIQHPLAQQVLNKSQQNQNNNAQQQPAVAAAIAAVSSNAVQLVKQSNGVRSYRKAIEETRQITSNLKRRLERPDLPESERRWLEQIYAYELILHQGWRHLAEYKASTTQKSES